ncbi:MAG: sugar phosphate isomerase/epimerase [Bacteroidaceae bacterium]|nr:sugar phosphate isomerase/epimerase [Bacteroidaceae bacterium]
MKISTCTQRLMQNFGLEACFKMIAEAGFDALDYFMHVIPWDDDHYQKSDDKDFEAYYRHVADVARSNGLEICQTHVSMAPMEFEDEMWDGYLRCCIRSVYATAYMESPYIVMHPIIRPEFDNGANAEEAMRLNLDFFGAIAPALKETSVVLCVENIFRGADLPIKISNFSTHAEHLIGLVDTLNETYGPYYAVCLDTGHAHVADGRGCIEMLKALGKRVRVLHVHDNDGKRDWHWLPGRGIIDWQAFCLALRDSGYDGVFNFEPSYYLRDFDNKDIFDKKVWQAACNLLYAVGRSLANIAEGKYNAGW